MRAQPARRRRRNPATAQLEQAFETALARISRAKRPAGERRWERSAEKIGNWLDAEHAPRQTFFVGPNGKPVPLRHPLMAHDRYNEYLDSHGSYQRRIGREQEREDAFYDSLKHQFAAERRRGYSPERAKALRERRKREVSVSPTASKAKRAAAAEQARREGKTLVTRSRGGGNAVARDWFARRYGQG